MQGYGDLGFGTWGPVFTVATAYALVREDLRRQRRVAGRGVARPARPGPVIRRDPGEAIR